MPDPSQHTIDRVREHMTNYGCDTACHFQPGADLEPRYLTAAAFVRDGVTILDAGCNSGAFGERLLRERKDVTLIGVEPNSTLAMLALGKGYAEVHIGLIEDVAQRIRPVDVVVAMDPLDYCIDVDACLAALLLPLRSGGLLINEGVHRAGRWGNTDAHSDLMRSWTPAEMEALLSPHLQGLVVWEVRSRSGTTDWCYCVGRKA